MADYSQLPNPISFETAKFTVSIPKNDLQDLSDLVRLSKLGRRTFENMQEDGRFGVTYEWMSKAKERWLNGFNWSSVEDRINAFPNFKSQVVDDDGRTQGVHFIGLFSKKKDAIPLLCIHGWPGSILEFLGILSALKEKYSLEELPYHIVVPSLPGYAFSDQPPIHRNWTLEDNARIFNKLMVDLGFGGGYAVQGGDIGSYTSRIIASTYDSCKAIHLNFCVMTCPDEAVHGRLPVEDYERKGLERGVDFGKFEGAYSLEHATRTSTIGFTLASSPLAVLAWIGEKFLTWADTVPDLDEILASVTLYWLTETFSSSIYPYRQEMAEKPGEPMTDAECRDAFRHGAKRYRVHGDPKYYLPKPLGYSWFPREIGAIPKSWVATTGNLVWSNHHDKGGHFAALEQPDALLGDIESFLGQVWR